MKLLQTGAIALVAALGLSACSSTGKAKGEGPEGVDGSGSGAGGPEIGKYGDGYGGGTYGSGGRTGSIGPQGGDGSYGAKGAGGKHGGASPDDPNGPLGKKVIYFQYDSSEVLPEYIAVINNHANYLASDKAKSVVLEGHADERGSPEYNIALGEQRAKSVAKLMKLQGVTEAQIQVVSFGEEKPQSSGHDDSAFQQNRRVEISYPKELNHE